jgi:uncharacterized protein (TIGR03083 family)
LTDWAAVYGASLDGVEALVARLGPADPARGVPATPGWTVHQVLAHLAGGASDGASGRMDGAPGPEWSARHVAERAGRSPAELVAELRATEPVIAAGLRGAERPALVWDKVVHLADLHEALGLGRPDPSTWQPVAAAMRGRVAHLLGVDAVDEEVLDDYGLVRVAFSRRSQRQLAALLPAVDPRRLATVGVFGPREDDQPVI